MMTPDQAVPDTEVRRLTPPEYVKYANARDARRRHDLDLHDFVQFLSTHRRKGAAIMRNCADDVDIIIADYLNSLEGTDG